MRVVLRLALLSVISLTVLPAWHSCRGQDSAPAAVISTETQQAQRAKPQQSAGSTPSTNPSSPRTAAPPAGAASASSTLDDTVDAGEMDDDIKHAPRGMAK